MPPAPRHLLINCATQTLQLREDQRLLEQFSVSTAKAGTGQQMGSGCTPLGRHRIRLKIGQDLAENAVLRGRRPTGEIYSAELARRYPQRDWILTRILWLTGLESGYNRGGQVDTLRRYIYIHGTPDSEAMGIPASHGCIRMRNSDLIKLFDQVEQGSDVLITSHNRR